MFITRDAAHAVAHAQREIVNQLKFAPRTGGQWELQQDPYSYPTADNSYSIFDLSRRRFVPKQRREVVAAVDVPRTVRAGRTTSATCALQGGPKKVRPQTHGHNSVKSQPIYIFLSLEDSSVNL